MSVDRVDITTKRTGPKSMSCAGLLHVYMLYSRVMAIQGLFIVFGVMWFVSQYILGGPYQFGRLTPKFMLYESTVGDMRQPDFLKHGVRGLH